MSENLSTKEDPQSGWKSYWLPYILGSVGVVASCIMLICKYETTTLPNCIFQIGIVLLLCGSIGFLYYALYLNHQYYLRKTEGEKRQLEIDTEKHQQTELSKVATQRRKQELQMEALKALLKLAEITETKTVTEVREAEAAQPPKPSITCTTQTETKKSVVSEDIMSKIQGLLGEISTLSKPETKSQENSATPENS